MGDVAQNLRPQGCEDRCRACSHRDWTKEKSEAQKRGWLESALGFTPEPLIGLDEGARWSYRDRVCLHAEWGGNKWKLGLRLPERRQNGDATRNKNEILDLPHCPAHSARVRAIQGLVADLPEELPLVYLVIAWPFVTLVLKCREKTFELVELYPKLAALGVRGLFVNFNPSAGDRVFFQKGWKLVAGESEVQCDDGLWHGPSGFHQLLPSLHALALKNSRDFLAPTPSDSVLDLYCGNGSSLLLWRNARSLGIELGGESVRLARKTFGESAVLQGKTIERVPQIDRWAETCAGDRLLFTNPPRTGMGADVCEWIGKSFKPKRIAYLSCSAGTLAKDLSVLARSGYALRKVTPYDFFPQTRHIEALAFLQREA